MELKNIEVYKQKLKNGNPEVKLVRPCHVNDGILVLDKNEASLLASDAKKTNSSIGFFIPASGSGSRMFSFVYQYFEDPSGENLMSVEQFFGQIEKLAVFKLLPTQMKKDIREGRFNMKEVLTYILTEKGLDIGSLPKALIPFHAVSPVVLNALQEQVIQAQHIHKNLNRVHFTIQEKYLGAISDSLELLKKMTGVDVQVDFSYQESETDVPALNKELELVRNESGEIIMRPAGHGALLHNLDKMNEEVILVKNIDNVQHWENRDTSKKWWNVLIGLLETSRSELKRIVTQKDRAAFASFNERYQILDESWTSLSDEKLYQLLSRPLRVCGMVRNVGQPGGGPYWIQDENGLSKQIVEKSQISGSEEQRNKMIQSTHFNPVMLALSNRDFNDNPHDLLSYVDHNKYFVVEKTHGEQKIKYIELPGLWNGSMAHWNTLFVEVPSATFSPVKSVLDLLDSLHQPKNE